MAASTVEGLIMRPVIIAINDMMRSVPLPPDPPKEKKTFGVTHYTCVPSKSKPAEYECMKGYNEILDSTRYMPNLVTKLAVHDENQRLRVIWADTVVQELKPSYMNRSYWACYDTKMGLECQEGEFQSALEEGRVKYISVPTLMPNHEWYIKQRWSRARIVEKYTDWYVPPPSDLNKSDKLS